jgi:hypothetical protein
MQHKCVVKTQYGSYNGTKIVYCDENDDNDVVFARAYKMAECNFLPMCAQSAKMLSRTEVA